MAPSRMLGGGHRRLPMRPASSLQPPKATWPASSTPHGLVVRSDVWADAELERALRGNVRCGHHDHDGLPHGHGNRRPLRQQAEDPFQVAGRVDAVEVRNRERGRLRDQVERDDLGGRGREGVPQSSGPVVHPARDRCIISRSLSRGWYRPSRPPAAGRQSPASRRLSLGGTAAAAGAAMKPAPTSAATAIRASRRASDPDGPMLRGHVAPSSPRWAPTVNAQAATVGPAIVRKSPGPCCPHRHTAETAAGLTRAFMWSPPVVSTMTSSKPRIENPGSRSASKRPTGARRG